MKLPQPWGTEVSIDLTGCDPDFIGDEIIVGGTIVTLCDEILKVKRHGLCRVVRYGSDPRISGISAVQLIEESSVSGHFVDSTGAAYINILSCKPFDVEEVVKFCFHAFRAEGVRYVVNTR